MPDSAIKLDPQILRIAVVRNFFYKNIPNILLVLFSTLFALVASETFVRFYPQVLGHNHANFLLTAYSTKQSGIYYLDHNCWGNPTNYMKPNFQTTAYYNGYFWQHETDSWGFRNITVGNEGRFDFVLLGDSFIYGHGVNIENTVSNLISENSNYSSYNLARQGDSLVQQPTLLLQNIKRLSPKYILYFFYYNDFDDIYAYLSLDKMNEFINEPTTSLGLCSKKVITPYWELSRETSRNRIPSSLLVRYFQYITNSQGERTRLPSSFHKTNREFLNKNALAWKYIEKAILKIDFIAQENGSQLIVIPIFKHKKNFVFFKKVIGSLKVPLIDTSSILLLNGNGKNRENYLKNDGHFSSEGAKTMAILVTDFIRQTEHSGHNRDIPKASISISK